MLKIKVNSSKFRIDMNGHANYAKQGQDIVCAAASILLYTLAETLQRYDSILKKKPEISVEEVDGNIEAFVECEPKDGFEGNITLVYQTVLNGFQLLAQGYPKNVNIDYEKGT